MDKLKYSPNSHPTHTYSSKARVLDEYLKDHEYYSKFSNIAVDIFDLYDEIEIDLPSAYNKTGGRYGAKKYSGYKDKKGEPAIIGKSKFGYKQPIYYKVPDGIMYPIVAAFRALIGYDELTDKYYWIKDPIEVYREIRQSLASKIMHYTDAIGNNPNATGKDYTAWDIMYMTVQIELAK